MQNGKSLIQKRARPQLSCTPCRTGKLKCDRNSPCNQCIKRSRELQCVFLPPPPKKSKSTRNAKDRISHLEDLVIQLINQNNDTPGVQASSTFDDGFAVSNPNPIIKSSPSFSSIADSSNTATEFGQMKISHGSTSYVGAAHWEAILNGVCGF
jgi:Fungal Zn(2)-Cys(6) binuclear cluster domain